MVNRLVFPCYIRKLDGTNQNLFYLRHLNFQFLGIVLADRTVCGEDILELGPRLPGMNDAVASAGVTGQAPVSEGQGSFSTGWSLYEKNEQLHSLARQFSHHYCNALGSESLMYAVDSVEIQHMLRTYKPSAFAPTPAPDSDLKR
jgi:hypothetical protein